MRTLLLCAALAAAGSGVRAQEPAVSTAPAEGLPLSGLKEAIRADLNALRRARYALRKALKASDARAEEAARAQIEAARARLKADRMDLRRALGRPPRRRRRMEPREEPLRYAPNDGSGVPPEERPPWPGKP